MKTLPVHAVQSAREYLYQHGRPLDQARYRFYFEGGNRSQVIAKLEQFQNADGGFGHALEPDLRTPASAAIATEQGMICLREIGAPAHEPVVERAVSYLRQTFDDERGVWPIVPPAVEDAPHAPWWTYAESAKNFGDFLINPTIGLIGLLYPYAELLPPDFWGQMAAIATARVNAAGDEINMFDLHCFARLASAQNLDDSFRAQLQEKVRQWAAAAVERNPANWGQYNLQPLDIVHAPDDFTAPVIERELLDANLDYLIDQQLPDGSWPIPWNWAFVDEQAWAQAEHDWKGHQIVNRLLVLRSYGRIEQ